MSYPVNLVLTGTPVLVVGGGPVARRKVEGLVAAGAVVTVVAPEVDDRMPGQATVHRRPYKPGEAADYPLVVVATDDRELNQRVAAESVWVNVADQPDLCTFTLPAIARQGPITVAVATEGQSPAMAVWLRDRIAALLTPEHEVLLGLLSEERAAIKARGQQTERLDWMSALDSNMLELIRAGKIGQARERLQACLSSSSD